jgi:hypothetical protein
LGETRQLAGLAAAGLIIGIIGLLLINAAPALFDGNLVVDSYDAVLQSNGTLTEHYTYDVHTAGEYRMLYRSWNAPLVFATPSSSAVEFVSAVAPEGATWYAKGSDGTVNIPGDVQAASRKAAITGLANTNEVGIFNPDYYSEGTYPPGTPMSSTPRSSTMAPPPILT